MVGVAVQEFLKGRQRFFGILKVVLIDLCDCEQRIEPVPAPGILLAQKFVLFYGPLEDFVVVEAPSHFHLQFGDSDNAGISFGGSGCAEVNAAVGIDHSLVIASVALCDGPPVESLAHSLSLPEVVARPRVAMPDTGVSWQRRQQREKRYTQTQRALASK
jgi:hypothetical protein